MKRLTALLLAAVMALSLAACSGAPAGTTAPAETTAATLPIVPVTENPVAFLSLTLGENYENIRSLTAFPNEDGTVHVEYVGDTKKVGDLHSSVLQVISAALEDSGLTALNGQENYAEGEANGSMYITYSDESVLSAGYSGQIPQAYTDGYSRMEECFAGLTADLPEYVPQPLVVGQVDEALQAELQAILAGSGIRDTDTYAITEIPRDDYFAYTLGLSSGEGIASAASLSAMMMTTPYCLSIVRLEEGADAEAVCADFAANVDWHKWVCVMPSNAMVACKDDLVLCLVAEGQLYSLTAIGIEQAGWTVAETLEKPN